MSAGETRISSSLEEVVGAAAGEAADKTAGELRLGRLRRVDAAEMFPGSDLAPWLRANPELLGEALRLEIRPGTSAQHPDAVGELTAGVPIVLKTAQSEPTENELRDVAALVADLDAGVLVLLAPAVPEQARQRLGKLNRNTTRAIVFYGVEVELWQIDDSAPAPLFRVVAGPDGWDRTPAQATPERRMETELAPSPSTGATAPG